MGCFTKFFLFVLNFAVFVIGVAVITLASLILADGGDFKVFLTNGVFTVPILLLVFGIFIMLVGFFGCFGALRESPCMLYTYATIVLILFIAQLSVAIYGLVKQDEIKDFLAGTMVDTFNKYGGDDVDLTKSLDVTQHQMKCCGSYNYTDWFSGVIDEATNLNGDVPIGCCRVNATNCNQNIANQKPEEAAVFIYTQGCYTLMIATIEKEALWLIIGAIVLALIQLGCVTIACGIGKRANQSSIY